MRLVMGMYEPVAFIHLETGDDLIVSFFVCSSDDPYDGRTITLLRDVKWECLLPAEDRGVKVYDEAVVTPDEQDNLLEEVRLGDTILELKSTGYARKLDLAKISKADRKAMKKVLRKMHVDRRFRLKLT